MCIFFSCITIGYETSVSIKDKSSYTFPNKVITAASPVLKCITLWFLPVVHEQHVAGLIESQGIQDLVAVCIQQGHFFQAVGALHTKPASAKNNWASDYSICVWVCVCAFWVVFYPVILPKVTLIPRTSGSTCKHWHPTSEKPQIRIPQLPTLTWTS